MGLVVCFALFVGAAQAVTDAAPAPAPASPSAVSDENAPDATDAPPLQDDNPYSAIVRGNVFRLTEPPKPQAKEDPAILNLPKVNITGFRRREGEPVRALFATVPKDPKESPKYFNLAEGEKEDILELKKIDPNQESVDVIIAGTPTTLTVKSNSFVQSVVVPKTAAAPLPGIANPGLNARPPAAPYGGSPAYGGQAQPQPIQPGQPQQTQQPYNPQNGGVIVAGGGIAPATASTVVAGGTQPQPGAFAPAQAAPEGTAVSTGGEAALRTIPTRGIRTGMQAPPTPR